MLINAPHPDAEIHPKILLWRFSALNSKVDVAMKNKMDLSLGVALGALGGVREDMFRACWLGSRDFGVQVFWSGVCVASFKRLVGGLHDSCGE